MSPLAADHEDLECAEYTCMVAEVAGPHAVGKS